MTMAGGFTLFDVAQRALSAQLVRMNASASNLANAGSVSGSEEGVYRPLRAIFAQQLDRPAASPPCASPASSATRRRR